MARSEPNTDSARPQAAALAAILVGIALTAVSFLPQLQSGSERWTTERARAYQDASLEIQNLTHHAATQTPETASRADADKLDQAMAHFQDLQQELEAARSQSAGLGVLLRVVGILLAIGGVIFYIAWRPTPPESLDHASGRFPSRTP